MGLIQVGRQAEIKESHVHTSTANGESCEGKEHPATKEEKGRRPRLKRSTETS